MAEEYKLDHNNSQEGVSVKDFENADKIIYNDATRANRMLTIAHIIAANARTKEGAITLFRTLVRESKLAVNHPQYGTRVAVIAATVLNWLKDDTLKHMPSGTQDLSLLNDSEVKITLDAVSLLTLTEEKLAFFLNVIEDTSFAVSTEANFLHIYPSFRMHMPSEKLVKMRNDLIKTSDSTANIKKIIVLLSKTEFTVDDAEATIKYIDQTVSDYIKFQFPVNSEDFSKNHEIIPVGKNILTLTDKKAMIKELGKDNINSTSTGFTSSSTEKSQEPEYRRNVFFDIRASLLANINSDLDDNQQKANIKGIANTLSRIIFETPISLYEMKNVLDNESDIDYNLSGLTATPSAYINCKTPEVTAAAQRLIVVKDDDNYQGLIGELRASSISSITSDSNFSSEDALTFGLLFGKQMKVTPMNKAYIKAMTARGVSDEFIDNILSNSIYLDLQGTFHTNDKLMVMFKNSRDMINASRATDVALVKLHTDNFAQRGEFRRWIEAAAASQPCHTLKFIDSLTPQKRLADAKIFGSTLLEMMEKDGREVEKLAEFFPSRTPNDTKILKRNSLFMINNFDANTTNPKQFKINGGELEFSVVGNVTDEEVITLELQRESALEIIRQNPRFDGRKTTWVHKSSINRPTIPYYENELMGSKKVSFVFRKADISIAFAELMEGNEYKGKFTTGFTDVRVNDMLVGSGSQAVTNMPDFKLLEVETFSDTKELSTSESTSRSGYILYFNVFDQFDSRYPEAEKNGVRVSNAKGFFRTLIDNTLKNFLNRQSVTILPLGLHEELKFKFRLKSPIDLLAVTYYKEIDLGFLTNKSIHALTGLDKMNNHNYLYDYKSISTTEYLFRALNNSAKTLLYNLRNYPTLFRILKEDSLIDNRLVDVVKDGMKAFTSEMQPFTDEQKIVLMSIILPTLNTLVNDFDKTWTTYKAKNTSKAKQKELKEKILRISPACWNADAYISENIPGLESIIGANASSLHLATESNVKDIIEGNTVTDLVDIAAHESDLDADAEGNSTVIISPTSE